jgi:hypothetical protein
MGGTGGGAPVKRLPAAAVHFRSSILMNQRLVAALVAFGVLFVLAFVLLQGRILLVVVILLAGLAAKTLIAHKAGW